MTPFHTIPLHLLLLMAAFLPVPSASGPVANLDFKTSREIRSYQAIADKIIDYTLHGPGKNQSYDRLALLADSFGGRLSGSQNLENAIDFMLHQLDKDGLDNVHGEDANVTHWMRNTEFARLVEPRDYVIAISGLGSSVGTPKAGILADAIVVQSYEELDKRSDQVKDRIVIFNPKFISYGVTVDYRVNGASRASKYGAVATLVRSITPFSIHSVHTGWQKYEAGVVKIPTASITVEDAAMFQRLQDRGSRIRIHLYMEAEYLPPVVSRNTIAEVRGSVYPEQVVVVSGHLDSWDVGQGAMDDGGGAFISWQALSTIRHLGLTPKRTIRLVMWTDEESDGVGSYAYYQQHKTEAANISILFESDLGVFTPYGIRFSGSAQAKAVMEEVGQLLMAINSSMVYDNGGGTDVAWWRPEAVPTASLANHNEKYFWFHHSDGDTMSVLDPMDMDLASAVWTVYAFVLADMETILPRG